MSESEGRAKMPAELEEAHPSLLGAAVLHDLLAQSERDLSVAQERARRASAETSQLSRRIAHQEQHAAALEAEVEKLRSHAAPRDDELRDLRERLSVADLAREEALALRRQVARLHPLAQSNTAALRILGALQAEGDALKSERDRLHGELEDARRERAALVERRGLRAALVRWLAAPSFKR